MTPVTVPPATTPADPFRTAARAYFAYGVVYWLGGAWLVLHGVGTRSGRVVVWEGVAWVAIGGVLVFLIPYLLRRPRAWFERWILCRHDLARVLAVFMAFRAFKVAHVALRGDTASIVAPWGGAVTFRAAAAAFFVVTVAALACVARAGWSRVREGGRP